MKNAFTGVSFDECAATLAAIVESSDDAIITRDSAGRIKSWNSAAERIFGYRAEEVVGGPISVIIPPDRWNEEAEILRRVNDGEQVERLETLRVRKDGKLIEVSLTITPVILEGRVVGLATSARELSPQKLLQVRLEREIARLRTTLESIGDAVIVTDMKAAVTFLNPAAEKLTGWTLDAALGLPLDQVFKIVNETTRRSVESPVARVLREGVTVGLANHTILIAKDGTEHAIDDCAAPIRDSRDEIFGVVLVFRDVTGVRAAEGYRSRLAAIVESSDDAIIGKDLNGRIMTWNSGASRLFGYSADEAIGLPISMLIPDERLDEEDRILRRIRNGERVEHFETVRVRKDRQPVQVSLTVSPIHDAGGQVIGASKIARDITERKATERELQETRARLELHLEDLERKVAERTAELQASNRELEAFAYSVAHDLKSPLRGIQGFATILEDELRGGLAAEHRETLRRIIDASEKMSRILEDLLKLSLLERQELRHEPTSLDELVANVRQELVPDAGSRSVEFRIGELGVVQGDPNLLHQALVNLIGNALKYTRGRAKAVIELGTEQKGDQTVYFIRDNGIGFNMDRAGKLFTPFHRLHSAREFEGSGIGLALVQRILRRHGGRIWAWAQPEEGATFYFTLHDPLGSGGHDGSPAPERAV